MKLLTKAISFAAKSHEEQFRKGTKIPYILHPIEVTSIVGTMTTDEEVLSAAVLHDVVEDTLITIEQINQEFGERVAKLVESETENKREDLSAEDSWKIRKQETIEHLKNAGIAVKMITLGDKLSNIRAIYRDYNSIGEELWERFNQKDKKEHYWYYNSLADCLVELKNYQAYQEYTDLIQKIFANHMWYK